MIIAEINHRYGNFVVKKYDDVYRITFNNIDTLHGDCTADDIIEWLAMVANFSEDDMRAI